MKKTLVVPIDFTPVSHEALLYACELSVNHDLEIVAVHILDTKTISEFHKDEDEEVRKMADQMYNDIIQKTKSDLDNFLDGLSVFYGDILRPLIAHGTIYEAFNEVAATYNSPLIVMGTHGIVGMQHVFGSKAYKVILNSPYPFLIVQERSYNTINKVYIALKTKAQLQMYAKDINIFSGFFNGSFVFNILSNETVEQNEIPEELKQIGGRFTFVHQLFHPNDIVECTKAIGADAIGICIDDADNHNGDTYGMTQDKILVNQYKYPVLCLPFKGN